MFEFIARHWKMEFVRHAFWDRVSGEEVCEYMQIDGRLVLASGQWSQFRVEVVAWRG